MRFLIQPLTDLTAPLYNIALGKPAKRQQETEKFILTTLRIGIAAIGFFLIRQLFREENTLLEYVSMFFCATLGYIHPYSYVLGLVNWHAFIGARFMLSTQYPSWVGKTIDMTAVVFYLRTASKYKVRLPRIAILDPYLVRLSKMIALPLFNNRRT
jgi:hypothetical protein